MHRTTFTKKPKTRIYKFDWIKEEATKEFNQNKGIYGSRRLAQVLSSNGIIINDRTLRNYMIRWGLITKMRVKRRKSESKNMNVKFADLVKRNFNPEEDNIVTTDVSYIPAKVKQNHVYLSVVISHKTKMIESWKISTNNDEQLVVDTLKDIKCQDFILHSDHGTQYSSRQVLNFLAKINGKTSMSRIGNSLDNREVEYSLGA